MVNIPALSKATDPTLRKAFYQARINDKSLSPLQRIAYMDTLIMLVPDDVTVRKLKSDLCFNIGDYANAATEYLTLAGRLSDHLGEHDRLRAMNYAAHALWFSNHASEANSIALDILRIPKSDSLLFYNLMARETAITTALATKDAKAVKEYITQQQDEINKLRGRKLINQTMLENTQITLDTYKIEYYQLQRDHTSALNTVRKALQHTEGTRDTVYINILLAGIYSDMGEDEAALDLYKRNIPLTPMHWNKRHDSNNYAELLLRNNRALDALTILNCFDDDSISDIVEVKRLKIKGRALKDIGRVEEAYATLLTAQEMEDSLTSMEGKMGAALREFEAGLAKDRLAEETRRGDRWRLGVWIILGLLVAGGITFGVIKISHSKHRKLCQNSNAANDSTESRQLVAAALQMSRMSEAITTISNLASNGAPGALEKIAGELKALDYSANTWEMFRSSFESMHPGFFEALTKDCPNMSIGEQRMAAYIILGLTNKEIATLINRQPRTVETIKYRLRKTLNIPADITTPDYLRRYLPIRSGNDN